MESFAKKEYEKVLLFGIHVMLSLEERNFSNSKRTLVWFFFPFRRRLGRWCHSRLLVQSRLSSYGWFRPSIYIQHEYIDHFKFLPMQQQHLSMAV